MSNKDNLWTFPAEWKCITTNGIVKANGELVMGAGQALQAKQRYPNLPRYWGERVKRFGNKVFPYPKHGLLSFPTKEHWRDNSTLERIVQSAKELYEFWAEHPVPPTIVLAAPGMGRGGLRRKEVLDVLQEYLAKADGITILLPSS